MIGVRARREKTRRPDRANAVRPAVEGLEGRLLLSTTTGTQWTRPERITYSFVPDGTSIGGVPSNLQSTLDARFPGVRWEDEFAQAAAAWQKVANVNFARVPDDGSPIGVAGPQQGDARFGDIRIGGYAQPSGQLAFAYLPPPANGGTNAGDIFFNTSQSWRIDGTTFDLETVAIHEFGHALGLDHSTVAAAAMWPAYTSTKQVLSADDIGGIRGTYDARRVDRFDADGSNNISSQADDITPYLNASGQLTLSGLDSTTPTGIASGDNDWFKVVAPATTTGTMVVRMQSGGLSLLSPMVTVFDAAGTTILGQQSSAAYGDAVGVTLTGVTPGRTYLIRARGATGGNSGYGAYALQVNFGAGPLGAVAVPNTIVARTMDRRGGQLAGTTRGEAVGVGGFAGRGDVLMVDGYAQSDHAHDDQLSIGERGHVGQLHDEDRGRFNLNRFAWSTTVCPSRDVQLDSPPRAAQAMRPLVTIRKRLQRIGFEGLLPRSRIVT